MTEPPTPLPLPTPGGEQPVKTSLPGMRPHALVFYKHPTTGCGRVHQEFKDEGGREAPSPEGERRKWPKPDTPGFDFRSSVTPLPENNPESPS